jgi:hypothetical protein
MRSLLKKGITTMDELMLLRDARVAVAPPTPEAMSAARSRLNEAVSAAQRSPLGGRLRPWSRSPRPRLGRLPRLALAGGLALALSVGTALALQPAGEGHGPGHARLAAWTVTQQADGELVVRLRQLYDPQGLRDLLRKHGVAARIEFMKPSFEPTTSPDLPSSCKSLPVSRQRDGELQGKIFDDESGAGVKGGKIEQLAVLGIRADAIPSGVGIFWQVSVSKSGDFGMDEVLVQASKSCTGT